jgi:LysM repeat protein
MAPELPDDLKEEVREFLEKKKREGERSKSGTAKPPKPEHPDQPGDISDVLGELRGMLPEEDLVALMEPEAEQAEVPEPEAERAEAPEPEARIHVVEKGDSLWKIAEKHYGDGTRWKEIHQANRDKIKDPNVIRRGQKLRIP